MRITGTAQALAATAACLLLGWPTAEAKRVRLLKRAPAHLTSSVTGSIQVGRLTRTYRLYLPGVYDRRRALPLVIALHGGGGS